MARSTSPPKVGGVRSSSNLDVLLGAGCDLVIALNPMSSLHAASSRTLGERLAMVMRSAAGRRLGTEARRMREEGTEVILVQPTVHDLDAMGTNLMSSRRRHEVLEGPAEDVLATVAERLEPRRIDGQKPAIGVQRLAGERSLREPPLAVGAVLLGREGARRDTRARSRAR